MTASQGCGRAWCLTALLTLTTWVQIAFEIVRDGKRDKVKLDEFAAAVETAKNLAETKHFQTVYVIDEADAKRTIGQPKPR